MTVTITVRRRGCARHSRCRARIELTFQLAIFMRVILARTKPPCRPKPSHARPPGCSYQGPIQVERMSSEVSWHFPGCGPPISSPR